MLFMVMGRELGIEPQYSHQQWPPAIFYPLFIIHAAFLILLTRFAEGASIIPVDLGAVPMICRGLLSPAITMPIIV